MNDSYVWIEYFSNGPLAKKYASYIKDVSENNAVTPTVVIYEVQKRLMEEKSVKSEQIALEAYATSPSLDYSAAFMTILFLSAKYTATSCPILRSACFISRAGVILMGFQPRE